MIKQVQWFTHKMVLKYWAVCVNLYTPSISYLSMKKWKEKMANAIISRGRTHQKMYHLTVRDLANTSSGWWPLGVIFLWRPARTGFWGMGSSVFWGMGGATSRGLEDIGSCRLGGTDSWGLGGTCSWGMGGGGFWWLGGNDDKGKEVGETLLSTTSLLFSTEEKRSKVGTHVNKERCSDRLTEHVPLELNRNGIYIPPPSLPFPFPNQVQLEVAHAYTSNQNLQLHNTCVYCSWFVYS